MKLRHRVALTVAASTTAALAIASAITVALFAHAQERELDRSLFARARLEAQESMQLGGRRIYIEQGPSGSDDDLEQLVKFGAMYRPDGRLMDDTATFGAAAPSLMELGGSGEHLPHRGFDLPFRGQTLRAVMVRVGSPYDPAAPILLLAAPRSDMESDARSLARVMAIVVALAAAGSLLVGWWIGTRMTRGIEGIAATARRIADGELTTRVDLASVGPGEEPASLGVDLNAMVDRLAALIETERRFASHAAHELRSPLAALRGELELALRRPRTEQAYREAIAEALGDTDRLIQLAEDLLAFVRSSVAGARPRERVRLSSLCERAVNDSLARADRSRPVSIDIDEDATIDGHPNDLARMLRNLIDNAIAHAPEGTAVRVVARRAPNGQAEIAVEDRGPGVPLEARERIFQPFFRAEAERARSGAGLGLAIAREIARAHGGDVVHEQESETTRFIARVAAVAGEVSPGA